MTVTAPIPLPARARRRPWRPGSGRRLALHGLLIGVALLWLAPLLWAVYTSLRPYADTAERGYVSLPGVISLENYERALVGADLLRHFLNTLLVVVPAVAIVLLVGAAVAFVASRFSWRWNIGLLVFFTCGSLLPPQVIVMPLFRLYLALPLPWPLSDTGVFYDQIFGLITINVLFQLGFCIFVLSSFMRSVPSEIIEAARLDGASIVRILWSIMLPLSRPGLAALAVLETTWIYNDFLWALVLTQTTARRPVTTAIAGLSGEFFTDYNVVAAASILVAIPTIVLFLVMRRQLLRGLTLGASSG